MKSCNNKNLSVKILVTYKDRHKIIKSDIITPIQTGRAIADEIFEDMIGDDTGDNISDRNPYYAELSAQYWAWKNYNKLGNPDYIGFMHYRRHFVFNENYFSTNTSVRSLYGYSAYIYDIIDYKYISEIGLDNTSIKNTINDYDVLCIKKADMRILNFKNAKEEWLASIQGARGEDYDKCMQIVLDKYPEYADAINELNKGPYRYFYNMFIMKKNLFFKYSEFLFSILEEIYKTTDFSQYPEKARRLCGYLGEFLLSIFIFKLYQEHIKVKELYSTFIKNTYYEEELNPAFSTCKNVIAMGCSNLYAPYLAVYLKSIYDNSVSNEKYDIVIFETDISKITKLKLLEMERPKNISLRFHNVEYLFSKYQLPVSAVNFARQCYYRLACGVILKNYKKVLYTDIDLIAQFNINDLFNIDLKGNPIAAPIEISLTDSVINKEHKIYLEENFDSNITYYNTGVMIIDIEKFNQITTFDELIKASMEKTYRWQEQCVINKVFAGKITPLDSNYNFEIYDFIYNNFHPTYIKYMKNIDNAKIYHFLAMRKVWFYPETLKGNIWWQYARQTPFYEEILARLINFRISQQLPKSQGDVLQLRNEIAKVHFPNINNRFWVGEYNAKLSFVMNHLLHFRLKKFDYALKKAFAFGERYAKYNDKYQRTKQLIKDAKTLKKSYYKV